MRTYLTEYFFNFLAPFLLFLALISQFLAQDQVLALRKALSYDIDAGGNDFTVTLLCRIAKVWHVETYLYFH